MSSSFLRRTALSAALATGAATLVAVPSSVAHEPLAQQDLAQPGTVELTGTLLVVSGENGEPDTYSVQRPNGQVVPIDPGTVDAFDQETASNSRFAGRVALPVVNGRATSLRGAVRRRTPLPVTSARIQERPTAQGPVVHRLAIAQVNNLGTYSRDSAALLAQAKVATDYWVDQADGNISAYEIPTSITPFATTKTTVASGCGLAGDQSTAPEFEPVAQEAAALFPGYDFVNGTDQLVVLMPDACYVPGVSSAVGRGRRGDSVSSGGLAIALNWQYLADTLAHEFGHNYGLAHAKSPTQEYGDLYEVMGAGNNTASPELGTGYRHEEGLLQAGEVASLTGTSGSASILDRAAVAETGVRGAEVIDPDNGRRLWFDLRTGAGSDGGSEYRAGPTAYGQAYRASGVVVEQDLEAGLQLLFTNGQTALAAGETWSNASGTMKVGVSAISGGAATLNSTYLPGPTVTGGSATVAGTVRPFEEVTAVAGAFAPVANGVRYQWFANGAAIPNEESATFDIPLSLAGASLSVQVTGYATGQAPSAPVMSPAVKVGPAIFYVSNGSADNWPVVSGSARTGQVLTTTGLNWVADNGLPPAGLASTFQWFRGSKEIKGATSASYELKPADLGQFIAVRNLASAPGFEQGRATSDSTKRVKKGKLPSAQPKIKFKGKKAKAGSKLKVKTGTWVKKVKFRFQWYANGHKINRANKLTFVVPRSLRKKKIAVKVMGAKKGYKATARKSSAVKIR